MVIQKFVDIAMFPGTYSSYDVTSYPETILIPGPIDIDKKIPCFLFIPKENSRIMIIYAHANGVDIGEIHGRLRYISERLRVNILLFDYPGYGKHEGRSDESNVDLCMSMLVNFVTQELNWPIENVVLWGCSIGTGPSTRYAKILSERKKNLGGLILQCPYKSIKHAAESLAGKIGRFLITQRWNIQSEILDCSCPVLWIHGKKDSLFSWIGSYEMYENYHINLRSCHFPKEATHHYFDIEVDIIQPIHQFLSKFVLPNSLPLYDRNCIKTGKKVKFSIIKGYNNKLDPFRPTVLDVYLTRNINVKISKENCYNEKKLNKELVGFTEINDIEDSNIRIVGTRDIKSILNFWSGSKSKEMVSSIVNNQFNCLYLEGDFLPKYIWLNGEAGEYINQLQQVIKPNSSSSIYLSSSGEDEFDDMNEGYNSDSDTDIDFNESDDAGSNEEFKCYNRLVNSNLISSNHMNYKNIKQCVSYNNINTNLYSIHNDNFCRNRRIHVKKRNVILNNPTLFRMQCRKRMEKLGFRSFTKSEELLLNFWPLTNLYCYLFDQYYKFFEVILNEISRANFSFINNSKDTFLSIIMWVRRLYYTHTPTLFMNSVYSYKSEEDKWILDGISIGNIYIQLQNINGINGRMLVKLLDKSPIFKCFPPPYNIVIPLYAPPKPFFQPIAEWIVRIMYRIHVYNSLKNNKAIKLNNNIILQKYPNIESYKDPMSQLETICLLEELSFSSLQHFLVCSTRPKIEKLALITGFGNWIPFGWNEFIIKIFESNSRHFLQRIFFLNSKINFVLNTNDFIKLMVPSYLPSFVNLNLIYKIIKTKIKTRSEWVNINREKNDQSFEIQEISDLIHPEILNNIFNTAMNVINNSILISNGLNADICRTEDLNSVFFDNSKYILTNKQLNWELILKDFDSFSNFMSKINFSLPKLSLPGISQSFRGNKIFENFLNNFKGTNEDSKTQNLLKSVVNDSFEIDKQTESVDIEDFKTSDKNTYINEIVENNQNDDIEKSSHDEIESEEQLPVESFQGKIVLLNTSNESEDCEYFKNQTCDVKSKEFNRDSKNRELPLTWESVFLNSQDPLLIINQLQYHDRIYMGMSPSNYIILHQLLYEKYSFLRLNHESENIFRLLWHFSHCCIYHGSLLNSSDRNKNFPYSTIHPLQCLLLIIGILRKTIENPANSDLLQLNWLNSSNEKQYIGFNSSCYNSSSNNKLNIIERILAISIELLENGICNQLVNYQINSSKCVSFDLETNKSINLEINDQIKDNSNTSDNNFSLMKNLNKTNTNFVSNNDKVEQSPEPCNDSVFKQHSSPSNSSVSSRISSFESLINQVYDGNIKNSVMNNYDQSRKVVIYSSNTKIISKNFFCKKEIKTNRIQPKKHIKETRVVNINNYINTVKRFSPIIVNQTKEILTEQVDDLNKKNSFELHDKNTQKNKSPSKLKTLASSSLKIFKR